MVLASMGGDCLLRITWGQFT